MFTGARHCLYPKPDESNPHIDILFLAFYLRPCLPSGLFPAGFPIKILYTFIIYPMHATFHARLIFKDRT
jgi:hypothetical protein